MPFRNDTDRSPNLSMTSFVLVGRGAGALNHRVLRDIAHEVDQLNFSIWTELYSPRRLLATGSAFGGGPEGHDGCRLSPPA